MPIKAPTHKPQGVKAPKHNPRGKDATNRQQKRAMHTGSKGWRAQRKRVLLRDLFTCRKCGKWGDQVDHIHNNAAQHVPDEQLQTLCLRCHSAKTMKEINHETAKAKARSAQYAEYRRTQADAAGPHRSAAAVAVHEHGGGVGSTRGNARG